MYVYRRREVKDKKNIRSDKDRQSDVAEKRKESGLIELKIYLDKETISYLEDLAVKHGYDRPTNKSYKRLDVLSKVITFCIVKKTCKDKRLRINSKRKQELYQLRNIAKYRYSEKKQSHDQIADFLMKHKYINPNSSSEQLNSLSINKDKWTENNVKKLLDAESFIKALNSNK